MNEIDSIIVIVSVFFTAFLSGLLGMGGGIILMGVLTTLLPVGPAIGLHGIVQIFSNSSRALLHRKSINYKILPLYLLGSIISYALFKWINFYPSKKLIFILLGAFPLIALFIKSSRVLSITNPIGNFLCGILVQSAQIMSGASGPLLDIFYIRSELNRFEIIASKALTQTFGHFLKILFYVFALNSANFFELISLKLACICIVLTIIGTHSAKFALNRISEKSFRNMSKTLILIIAGVFLIRGITL